LRTMLPLLLRCAVAPVSSTAPTHCCRPSLLQDHAHDANPAQRLTHLAGLPSTRHSPWPPAHSLGCTRVAGQMCAARWRPAQAPAAQGAAAAHCCWHWQTPLLWGRTHA
jgi:hypothetical protein